MSDIAVDVQHVWKKFHLGEMHDSLRDLVPSFARRLMGKGPTNRDLSEGDFWALRDVSFQVRRGETFALVGHNGAGKSTMLKILSRILKPNRGRVVVHGKLRALIEVASGFHPDLSGRENIYLNGAILGMRQREIDKKFDEIVSFAGVGPFLDTPVKRYSSGMQARLGFAVAAHLDPEILLVDEVLSVGDREFQDRCLRRMQETADAGTAVLFVSHNLAAVQQFCNKGILLSKGTIVQRGPIADVVHAYIGAIASDDAADIDLSESSARRPRSQPILSKVRILGPDGKRPTIHIPVGAPMTIELTLRPKSELVSPFLGIWLDDSYGRRVFSLFSPFTDRPLPPRLGESVVRCTIDEVRLATGVYHLSFGAGTTTETTIDVLDNAASFEVVASDYFGCGSLPDGYYGAVMQRCQWQVQKA